MTLPSLAFLPTDVVLDRFLRRTRAPLPDLTGRDQTREISRRRQELMWLLRQLTTASMGQIGAMPGGRTAATVDEGVNRVSMRALNEPVYRKALADLREAILTPEPVTVERILAQHQRHQRGQPVMTFPDRAMGAIGSSLMARDRFRRDHDPNPVRREDHAPTVSARATDAIRSAEAPASRRMATAPTTNSALSATGRTTAGGGSSPGPSINVANSTGSSGAGRTSRPFRASVRQDDTWFAGKPCRRATSFTVAPGSSVSATTRAFTSSGHFRFQRPRPPTGRTSNAVSMEKLPPDHHEHPMRRSAQSLEGAVQPPLTVIGDPKLKGFCAQITKPCDTTPTKPTDHHAKSTRSTLFTQDS
ncbi:helix-turn-helix domain-containing protein [Pseudogemmobacter sonorensis]|uniref:helix-turn-helix domain-containing protein n=1 Tax=Pseudogemmobacter sonorensis TaxID=2989681 RepID=UPI003F6720E9